MEPTLTATTKRFQAAGHPGLVYDELGDPAAPPVVLLHGGAAGWRRTWLDIPERLAATFRVFALDMRGHGDSDWAGGDYRIEHYASDVEAFIERVAGGQAALVGHSWGGLVAAQVAGTRQELVTGAFFEDAPLGWERYPGSPTGRIFRAEGFLDRLRRLLDAEATVAELWAAVHGEGLETGNMFGARRALFEAHRQRGASLEEIAAVGLAEPLPTGDGTWADRLDGSVGRAFVVGLLACDPAIFTTRRALAAYDRTRPMRCRVHLLRADPATGWAAFPAAEVEPFLDAHPAASVELVEGASHAMHLERPEWFARRLATFLGGG